MEENDIYFVTLDPSVGREQGGTRPVIVIRVLRDLNLCVVVPLTTKLERLSLQYAMQVNKTSATNLDSNSVALVFQLRTISFERTKDKIGRLEDSHAKKIRFLIKEMLLIQ